jgi:hypothetical protein
MKPWIAALLSVLRPFVAALVVAPETGIQASSPSSEPATQAGKPLQPVVEFEEELYTYKPADNGAGPMWCFGNTCIVRISDKVFASGIRTLADYVPLNNVRWMWPRRTWAGCTTATRERHSLLASASWIEVSGIDSVWGTRRPTPQDTTAGLIAYSLCPGRTAARPLSPLWAHNQRW